MALIKCSECGRDVSDTAKNCPHCGNVIGTSVPQVDQKGKTAKIIAIIASAGVAVFSFLPFLQLSYFGYTESVTMWAENFLWLTIIGFVLLLIAFMQVVTNNPKGRSSLIAVGVIFPAELIFNYISNMSRFANINLADLGLQSNETIDLSSYLSPGIGMIGMIICSIGLLVAGVMMKKK